MGKSTQKLVDFLKKGNLTWLLVIAAAVVIFTFVYPFGTRADDDKSVGNAVSMSQSFEQHLGDVLREIDGVGRVSIIIRYTQGETIVPATNKRYDAQTGTLVSEDVASVGSDSVVLKTQNAEIGGVVIVAEGAQRLMTRLRILDAVTALTGVDQTNIEILPMGKQEDGE